MARSSANGFDPLNLDMHRVGVEARWDMEILGDFATIEDRTAPADLEEHHRRIRRTKGHLTD